MIKRGVWRNKRRRDVPEWRRCVKCKWVFDIKRDGRFRPRLVACGYSQVAGVDFTANFAPVINDVTWRILMVTMIVMNLEGKMYAKVSHPTRWYSSAYLARFRWVAPAQPNTSARGLSAGSATTNRSSDGG